jgi:hypothetical protein
MRAIAQLVLFFVLSGVASAQTAEKCPPTARAGDFLACYNNNKTEPPTTQQRRATSGATPAVNKPTASRNPTERRAQVDDLLDEENKQLDTRVNTLCRGC